ncbi:MAG: hypothetical protein ACLSUW_00160 [Akkermansia sp.]
MKCWPLSKIWHRHDEGGQDPHEPAIDQELKNLGHGRSVNACIFRQKTRRHQGTLSPAYAGFLERKWNARTSCHAGGNPPPSPGHAGQQETEKTYPSPFNSGSNASAHADNPSPLMDRSLNMPSWRPASAGYR